MTATLSITDLQSAIDVAVRLMDTFPATRRIFQSAAEQVSTAAVDAAVEELGRIIREVAPAFAGDADAKWLGLKVITIIREGRMSAADFIGFEATGARTW